VRLGAYWVLPHGVPYIATREPGGTTLGEEIRQILLHGRDMPAETELLLYNAARAVFVKEVVRPALADGKVVVADRFWLSTMAYQGGGRGLPIEEVRRICEFATGGLRPDLTVIVDLPVETGMARLAQRSDADRIERAGTEFHQRVAEAYRLLPSSEAGVESVSGSGTPAEVHQRIIDLLSERFPETFVRTLG
jgi:dTMP kinase